MGGVGQRVKAHHQQALPGGERLVGGEIKIHGVAQLPGVGQGGQTVAGFVGEGAIERDVRAGDVAQLDILIEIIVHQAGQSRADDT